MTYIRSILPALAIAAASMLPAAAQETADPETVVATVNGQDITLGHMIVAFASLPEQYQQYPSDILFKGILDQLVQQTALAQSFEGDVPARVTLSLENEERSLKAGEAVESVMSVAVTDEALQAAYDAQYSEGSAGEEYNASHILVETEAEAAQIVEDLKNGADFAETAKEKSTGPSGPSGGELGWFGAGQMVPEFEAAVMALETGAISNPVQTQFGWHVVKLNNKRAIEAPTLDEVRGELALDIQRAAVEAHIEALVNAAEVDRKDVSGLSTDSIRNLDLLGN